MKNLKKVFALVLSLAMIVSTFTVSFAAEDTKTDADICEALELIKGDGDGVTEEYLGTESPRWKLALMSLRLRGLEDEALAFEGTETFADAEEMTWVAGRAALAYLKANPELGWLGRGEEFDPNGMMTVQEYYKVMLGTLGYTQGEDFEWEDVMTFAEEKNLVAAADAEKLTMADVAAVTVETLKAETKDGAKLIQVLVEDGAITDVEVAKELGYEEPVIANLVIKSAQAMNASYVKLTLKEDTEVVPGVEAFSIVDEKDNALDIEDVVLYGAKDVRIKTAVHTKNLKYTITYGDKSFDYVGLAADTTAPKVTATAVAKGYKTADISFDDVMDKATAEVAANYTIKDRNNNVLAVENAELTADSTVRLTTAEQKAGELYTITVSNVYNLEGLAVGTSDNVARFGGVSKLAAAKVTQTAIAKSNTKVQVLFDQELDKDTAEDISNYTIKDRSGNALVVLEAKVVTKDEDATNYNKSVYLTTAEQKAGELYTITVANVNNIDGVVVDSSNKEAKFGGMAKDTTAPKVEQTAVAKSNSTVEVIFKEEMDATTANDVANYTIKDRDGKAFTVLAAELQKGNKIVRLTTEAQKAGMLYTITITNVKDISGNTIDSSYDEAKFGGLALDTAAPKVVSSYAKIEDGVTYVYVDFDKNVDAETATVFANYKFDNDLGYGLSAEVQTDGSIVKVKTNDQGFNTMYKVTVTGVKSADGVVIGSDNTASFAGVGADVKPEVSYAVATNIRTVEIYLNTTVADSAIQPSDFTIAKNTNSSSTVAVNSVVQDKKAKKLTLYLGTDLVSGTLYDVEISTASNNFTNERGTAQTDAKKAKTQFAGVTTSAAFKVDYIMPIDNKTIDIYFNGVLADQANQIVTAANVRITGGTGSESFNASAGTAPAGTPSLRVLPNNKSVLRLTLDSDTLVAGRVYQLWFKDNAPKNAGNVAMALVDASNNIVKSQFAGSSVAQGKPSIDYIMPKDDMTLTVKFKTPVTNFVGTESSTKLSTTTTGDNFSTATAVQLIEEVSSADGSEYTVYLNKAMKQGVVYTLTIANATANVSNAQGAQDNDITATVAGTNASHAKPAIATASVSNDRKVVTVTMNQDIASLTTTTPVADLSATAELTTAQLAELFDIVGIFEDGSTSANIVQLTSGDSEVVDVKTIKFELSKALKTATTFKVRSKDNKFVDKTTTASKVSSEVKDSDYIQVSVPNVDTAVATPGAGLTANVVGVKATKTFDSNGITVTAKNTGTAGNNIQVVFEANTTDDLEVSEANNIVTIKLAKDTSSKNTGTLIAGLSYTLVDVVAAGTGNTELGIASAANLENGVDAVLGSIVLTFNEQMNTANDTLAELGLVIKSNTDATRTLSGTTISWNSTGTVLTIGLDTIASSVVSTDKITTLNVNDLNGNALVVPAGGIVLP
ncbi:Ig-like domain-containing protein [Vallitalea guaymasensis]|uniref:X-Prolyl dipeptidyl aminopeptidase PepX N-terminal domain-containing protein n=1 Tax=Vallitalea guaymasensis TaxID=1185412 RepID=A0A8J8SC80_9FIRM|nr:Ig-like domain-containing protein [Vallitalea guaymasensis]QUH29156.1 hypothetical protein HYG85_09555 [Vallitalea guaymasensis]